MEQISKIPPIASSTYHDHVIKRVDPAVGSGKTGCCLEGRGPACV